ncbi:MAG: CbiQ family ECF transporter T component [Actinomycetota bacterium]|nr:CbiQ family ECF transporter T component [Actinomycetota bacterium]
MLAFIEMDNVWFGYDSQNLVISGLDLEFERGFTTITGPNGSGKTTLGKLMAGILKPQKGRVLIDGLESRSLSLGKIGTRIGYLFQNPELQIFSTAVAEELSFVPRLQGVDEEIIEQEAFRWLKMFGLEHKWDSQTFNLSYGQKQRLALAALMINEPSYLILDEPTTGLDMVNRELLIQILTDLKARGVGIAVISHDEDFVASFKGKHIEIDGGRCMKPVLGSLDIRVKLIMVMCLSTTAVFIQNAYVLGFLVLVSVLLSRLVSNSVVRTLKATKKLWYILIAIVVVQSIFSSEGRIILAIGSFPVLTMGGLVKGLEFILRLSVIIISASIVASSNYRQVVQGLVQMRIPYEIAFMVSVGIRFLPMLRNEFQETMVAIQLRGLEIEKLPLVKRLKLYSYVFTPVVAGAIHKAQKLSIAMETRAFRAYDVRTSHIVLKLAPRDYIGIFISLLATVAIFVTYYVFRFPGRII